MKPCEKCANVGYLVSEEPCKSCNGFNNFEPITPEREEKEKGGAE